MAALIFGGLAVLIGAAIAGNDPRNRFLERLRAGLAHANVAVTTADLARGPTGPTWLVTLRLPNGTLFNLQAAVEAGVDPFAAGDGIAQRIRDYLRQYGLAT